MNGSSKPSSASRVHCTPRVVKPSDSPARARLSSVAPEVVTLASSRSLPSVIGMPWCRQIIARHAAPQSISSACSTSAKRRMTRSPNSG